MPPSLENLGRIAVMIRRDTSRQLEGPPAAFITQTGVQSEMEQAQACCYIRRDGPRMFTSGFVGGHSSAWKAGRKIIKDRSDRSLQVLQGCVGLAKIWAGREQKEVCIQVPEGRPWAHGNRHWTTDQTILIWLQENGLHHSNYKEKSFLISN